VVIRITTFIYILDRKDQSGKTSENLNPRNRIKIYRIISSRWQTLRSISAPDYLPLVYIYAYTLPSNFTIEVV